MPEITLLLHNIRSTHNVGSIFRTAEGFGVSNIILSGYTPYPRLPDDDRLPHEIDKLHRQIHKTALGAETMVPFEHYATLDDWLDLNDRAKDPLVILALEQSASSVNIGTITVPTRFALLLGEEVNGIDPRNLERCDTSLEIPMRGQKESFNVAVATGIALYALSPSLGGR